MPPLKGFSDNAFQTHDDFKTACLSLLRALKPYQSPGGARIKLPLETGTHFDDVAAQLEGFARPLWAVGTLMHSNMLSTAETQELVDPYVRGLANGTDPQHPEYWGPVVLRDQRMVEMEIISFALLAAPDAMFNCQTEDAKFNITQWLKTINGKDFPTTNWLWFRVMTNLALTKVCGVPREQVLDAMKADLDLMEQFYLGDGWAADGIWSEKGRQADYYSGSFAIQFSQLIYARFAHDLDPERCERFRSRAVEFAKTFWRYFDTNGAAIPFGRSLTYRFAFAGFWSALAFSGIPPSSLAAPLNSPGVIKGLLLRHFSWWRSHPSMFNIDGTLTIGFTYPNMYMSEDYNSPQSVYWALKSFLALGLLATHAFWAQEPPQPLPVLDNENTVKLLKQPRHILVNGTNHHYLLNMGQFCPWPLKATEAKYTKYAYSSHFGFSVPTGPLLQQRALDSTLALSRDGGQTWRVPWGLADAALEMGATARLMRGADVVADVHSLRCSWSPWTDAHGAALLTVHTTLVAPCPRWPDWYVTRHRVVRGAVGAAGVEISAVQGGFAIQGRGWARGENLPEFDSVRELVGGKSRTGFPEGTVLSAARGSGGANANANANADAVLICSGAGASGIRQLHTTSSSSSSSSAAPAPPHPAHPFQATVLKPDANTNLIWQRTLIPTVQFELGDAVQEAVITTGVFALARTADREARYDGGLDLEGLWGDVPVLGKARGRGGEEEYWICVD
ncbi:hypothetical protein J1614_010252 [Plenodomus biglobosus]|nr:hypothetical protein J1614_010252 [Plenodomus biglobosus]